eukprot:3413862-Rhodomonas_salina.1
MVLCQCTPGDGDGEQVCHVISAANCLGVAAMRCARLTRHVGWPQAGKSDEEGGKKKKKGRKKKGELSLAAPDVLEKYPEPDFGI